MKTSKRITRKGSYDITINGNSRQVHYKEDTYYTSLGRKIGFSRKKRQRKNTNIYVFGSGNPAHQSKLPNTIPIIRKKAKKCFETPSAHSHDSLSRRKDVAVYQYKYHGRLLLRDYEWD